MQEPVAIVPEAIGARAIATGVLFALPCRFPVLVVRPNQFLEPARIIQVTRVPGAILEGIGKEELARHAALGPKLLRSKSKLRRVHVKLDTCSFSKELAERHERRRCRALCLYIKDSAITNPVALGDHERQHVSREYRSDRALALDC